MEQDQHQLSERRRRTRHPHRTRLLISWLMFGVAGVIIAILAVNYYQDRQHTQAIPTPPVEAGHYQLVNVVNTLRDAGLSVKYEPVTARSDQLTEAGQKVSMGSASAFVFIYPDVASREAESKTLDSATFSLTNTGGTPVATPPAHVVSTSNIIVALFDASADVTAKVDQAIQGMS
ncbi:MAG TPA: hypothetical protein VFL82_12200 [Thermomicrobiales bacterium]|nr:hypothetical protein [Thermomicrobiales bacterium]